MYIPSYSNGFFDCHRSYFCHVSTWAICSLGTRKNGLSTCSFPYCAYFIAASLVPALICPSYGEIDQQLDLMEHCLFAENFWGEKNTGFDVLYQNLKSSCRSTSDFAEFVRESSSIEDAYYKSLLKLAKQTASYSNNNFSSFKPCWSVLRQLVEQLGQLHLAFAQSRQNLSKDVQRYLEEQQKRHKSIRDAETSTQEVVHAFQVGSP